MSSDRGAAVSQGQGQGLSVIAMSLYGAGRRYTMGAVRNAQLAPVTFPGWQLRFYVERGRADKPARYAAVPDSIVKRLQQLGAELIDSPSDRLAPMMWRFTVIYLFIYYTVYAHVKSFTIVKNRKCGQVTSHCRKARPYRADLSLFLNVPVVTVKSETPV